MSPTELGITKPAYTRKETAKLLSCGLTLIDQMIADQTLKSVKLGKYRTAKRLILGPSIAQLLTEGLAAGSAA